MNIPKATLHHAEDSNIYPRPAAQSITIPKHLGRTSKNSKGALPSAPTTTGHRLNEASGKVPLYSTEKDYKQTEQDYKERTVQNEARPIPHPWFIFLVAGFIPCARTHVFPGSYVRFAPFRPYSPKFERTYANSGL
ncbi:hypothetical protein RHS02_06028, partial [Rhizoctonia solani]